MKIRIEINEEQLKRIVVEHIGRNTGINVDAKRVAIQVKSKQNYKSEWEDAAFRAVYETNGERLL